MRSAHRRQIRSGTRFALTTVLAVMLFFSTSAARANGRFPRGEHLIESPNDPNRLILAATYGLVTTEDGGKNWYHICETAFSYYPPPPSTDVFTGDPLLILTADESLIAGVQKRITRSNDRACGWTKVLEDASQAIDDIAAAPTNRNNVFALVRTVVGTGSTQVYESTNGGVTWAPIGTNLPIVTGYTIDVDPQDPMHLKVSGVTSYDPTVETGVFLNSANHGMTWTTSPIPKTNINSPPYIAAVHPTDGKKIFVRTDEWVRNAEGNEDANDALLYTKDGGQSWTELLRPKGVDGVGAKLYAFALSPDGSTALAGFGDPVVGGGRIVDREVMGVYKSSGADYAFGTAPRAIFVESATCLTWTSKGIYVCGSPDGMTSYVSFAADVGMVSSTGLTKIMRVDELKGSPPCCAGRARSTCEWTTECLRFDACGDGGGTVPPPDASACMTGMPDAGGGGAGTGAAGTGGSGGGDGSCGCRMPGRTSVTRAEALGLLFVVFGGGSWRRSQRRRKIAA